jgi:hypothetical protein
MAFPAPFVRGNSSRPSNLTHNLFQGEERQRRKRKIFVIKQVRQLPAANGPERQLRRVLIFDNHPDSLRLVFGHQADRQVDFAEPKRTSLWEFVLIATTTFGLAFGMFWPLLFK